MKNFKSIILIITILLSISVAAEEPLKPEFSAPTPAEKQELTKDNSDLSPKERENWNKLRKERREAREQVFSEIRKNGKEMKSERRNANSHKKENSKPDRPKKLKKKKTDLYL